MDCIYLALLYHKSAFPRGRGYGARLHLLIRSDNRYNTQHSVSRPRTIWHVDCRGRGPEDDRSTSVFKSSSISVHTNALWITCLHYLHPGEDKLKRCWKNIPRIFTSMASHSLEIQNLWTCNCISCQRFTSGLSVRALQALSFHVSQNPVRTRPYWTLISGEDRETLPPLSAGGCEISLLLWNSADASLCTVRVGHQGATRRHWADGVFNGQGNIAVLAHFDQRSHCSNSK